MKTRVDRKSGRKVAEIKPRARNDPSKTNPSYWRSRLVKQHGSPDYSARVQHAGRREWFNTRSGNAEVAAVRASEFYCDVVLMGWAAATEKHRPKAVAKTKVCTVGEFVADVEAHSHIKPITVRRYAVKLRKIISDVAELEKGMKKKAKLKKFDYVHGGRVEWLGRINSQPLDVLTPEKVSEWRNDYVAKAGSDPLKRKSAERSAASYLRCCKALFAPDVLRVLSVTMPPNPFAGVKVKDPGPQRYRSDINPEWLLTAAVRELKPEQPQAFLGLVLCLWGGLRRKEADTLTWAQVDLVNGQIHIRRTAHFEPKTEESQRSVDIPQAAVDILRSYMGNSPFVMEGGDSRPGATYDYYRCDGTWRVLIDWLKTKGITQQKAIHSLRKESGSLIASAFGIEAARYHLGHRSIKTTSAHYVSKRKRIEVNIGGGEPPGVSD
ncbi:integrase [Ereboglobus sp. PH5-10]|uniref:tyrosine-type recombinase/integrase n=1 Tax=Ereboglobus sp. PH5-10 TaxID=2940629 RepID=UPI00240666D6|nr:tyrosine-type recombinase/integrase [Ereboglobus sp. PH5-10]MDF9827860.1 integrase [Ereboglobus sp. PH5-10]